VANRTGTSGELDGSASLLTTLSGRVVSADQSALRLLNCPSSLLTGAFFPAFVREPSARDLPGRSFVTLPQRQEWAGVIKPLRQPPMAVTIQVEPTEDRARPGPRWSRRGLAWNLRPRRADGAARPVAGATDRALALEQAARRLGRELHDEAGQLLAAAHLALDGLECSDGCPTHDRLPQVKGILDQVEDELRRLSHDLRPALLDSAGLGAALRELAQNVSLRYRLEVTVHDRLLERLRRDDELHLFRISQEAVGNAARHAAARGVVIRLFRSRGETLLEVEDDGCGLPAAGHARRGLGFLTMAERAALLGGSLEVVPRAGSGTTVRVRIPNAAGACAS
jgi:signal transduction histidine kinase